MPDTHGAAAFAPITVAEITDEVWLEAGRQPTGERPPSPPAPPALAVPVAELLALEGEAFIAGAYQAVLGRQADRAGAEWMASQIAHGRGKTVLLSELLNSPEGRQVGRSFPDLPARRPVWRLSRFSLGQMVLRLTSGLVRRWAEIPRVASLAKTRRALEAGLVGQQASIETCLRRLDALQAAQEDLRRKSLATTLAHERQLSSCADQRAGFAHQIAAMEESVISSLLAVADDGASHGARLAAIEATVDFDAVAARIETVAGGLRAELDGRVIAAEAVAAQTRRDVNDQQRRIGLMLHALRARVPETVAAEDDHALDGLYLEFEDRFRGTRSAIKERQRVYLPRLLAAGAGGAERPVLDIGAGRGEFLDLLRDEGLVARGVDANATMAAACQKAGLDCTQGDALTYLAAQREGSLGAVTGFHIVEHLPFKVMVRILDEALRALGPGGLIVFETPNPANILTASRYFYLDPTHRNPLPGEMMAMIAEARGFTDIEIVALHPMDARFPGADRQLAAALDTIFHGPQDYALVARRP